AREPPAREVRCEADAAEQRHSVFHRAGEARAETETDHRERHDGERQRVRVRRRDEDLHRCRIDAPRERDLLDVVPVLQWNALPDAIAVRRLAAVARKATALEHFRGSRWSEVGVVVVLALLLTAKPGQQKL